MLYRIPPLDVGLNDLEKGGRASKMILGLDDIKRRSQMIRSIMWGNSSSMTHAVLSRRYVAILRAQREQFIES